MSTFDLGAPVLRRTGTHLPLAGRQLVRNREIGRSKVCTIEPLVARSVTVASPNAASPLACNLNGVLMAPLRGTVSIVAVCNVTPAGRFLNLQPHVAAEIIQRDQVNCIRVVETVEGSPDVARFYRGGATDTARQPTTHDVAHEVGRLVVRGEREVCHGGG